MFTPNPNRIAASALLCIFLASENCLAQSSWQSLPDETVVALRIPDGEAFANAFMATKLGATMLNEKRRNAVVEILESDRSSELGDIRKQLQEFGLETADLWNLMMGESGYAVVKGGGDEDESQFFGMGWLEPGEELAAKVYGALGKVIENQDDEQPITRVDLKLGNRPVMQLRFPSIELEHEEEFMLGEEYEDLPEEEQGDAWEKAYEEWQESAVELVVYRTMLICQFDNRLLITHSYESEDEETAEATAERLSALLGRWIAAHATSSGNYVAQVTKEPGAARVMALEGLSVLELLGDLAPLVELLRETAPSDEKAEQLIGVLGLDGLGAIAMRASVAGKLWRTQMSVAAPAPRQGLMQLLDQESLAIDPPQWVPASVVRYHQWSFDLGKAYEIFKTEATRMFPEQAGSGFAMVEAQVQNFAGASLTEVLGSLGNRHTFMSFGMESGGGADKEAATERMAAVWQVEDEDLWAKLLKVLTPLAGMATGAEFTEEQGFSGWRMTSEEDEFEGGLFLGKGYLVLAIGEGVLESVLSSLNNPPSGSNAFRGSTVFSKAGDLVDLEPALAIEVTDGNRYMRMMQHWMNEQLDSFETLFAVMDNSENDSDDESTKLFFKLARAVLPTADEVEGMLDVIVNRYEVNDAGMFLEGVQVMPGK